MRGADRNLGKRDPRAGQAFGRLGDDVAAFDLDIGAKSFKGTQMKIHRPRADDAAAIRPRARVLGLSRAPVRQPEARALRIVFREQGQPQNRGRTTAKKTVYQYGWCLHRQRARRTGVEQSTEAKANEQELARSDWVAEGVGFGRLGRPASLARLIAA